MTKRLRILMLHGYTQSGPLFHSKTRALEKSLQKAFPSTNYCLKLCYPTGPSVVMAPNFSSSSIDSISSPGAVTAAPSYGWFKRKGDEAAFLYEGLEDGLAQIAISMRQDGPFDGVIGFSQGAFMAGILSSLLEEDRRAAFEEYEPRGGIPYPAAFLIRDGDKFPEATPRPDGIFHPSLKFIVSYSGFTPSPNALYSAFYTPAIKTPSLHFLGSVDTVIEQTQSQRFVDACEQGSRTVIHHPGGHFVPTSRTCTFPLLGFIKQTMGWEEGLVNSKTHDDFDIAF